MIAVALDPAVLPAAVAGHGSAALRRYLALRAGGAHAVQLFSDQPDEDMHQTPNALLRCRLPDSCDLAALRVLWIVGLPEETAAALAARARAAQVLVNVEDRPALCDFHNVAEVRRGGLLLTVSPGGASPGLAARIRARLSAEYGPEWGDRLATLRDCRAAWRCERHEPAKVAALTDALLQANGWLA